MNSPAFDLVSHGVNTRWRRAGPNYTVVNALKPDHEGTRVMTINIGNEPPTNLPAGGAPFGEPAGTEVPALPGEDLKIEAAPPPRPEASFIPSWNHAGLND
jgi:hypothetical protein